MRPHVSKVHLDQDYACWESEHLFGVDLFLGSVHDERLVPLHQFCMIRRPSDEEWAIARRWCIARMSDNYAMANGALGDIADRVYQD